MQLTTVPHYWDGQMRVDQELSSRWKAAVTLLGTRDVAELIADDEADADERFYFETSFARLIADARYHDGPWSAQVGVSPIAQRVHFALGQDIYYKADKLGGTARGETRDSNRDDDQPADRCENDQALKPHDVPPRRA